MKVSFERKTFMLGLGKVNISIFAFAAVFGMLIWEMSLYTAMLFCCIAVHELSHLAFIRGFSCSIKKVNVYPFGIDIFSDMDMLPFKKELACILSGPLSNIVLALLSAAVFCVTDSKEVLFFCFANTVFGAGNLVPLDCFDGGRAVKAVIRRFFLPLTAYRLERVFGIVSPVMFFLFCSGIIVQTGCNYSAVLSVACAAIASCVSEKCKISR